MSSLNPEVHPVLSAWWAAFDTHGVPGTGLGEAVALSTRYLQWQSPMQPGRAQDLTTLQHVATQHYGIAPARPGFQAPDRDWLELWARQDVRRGNIRWHGSTAQPRLTDAAALASRAPHRTDPDGAGSEGTTQRYWLAVGAELARHEHLASSTELLTIEADAVSASMGPDGPMAAIRTYQHIVQSILDTGALPQADDKEKQDRLLATTMVRWSAAVRAWRELQWAELDGVRRQLAAVSSQATPPESAVAQQAPRRVGR